MPSIVIGDRSIEIGWNAIEQLSSQGVPAELFSASVADALRAQGLDEAAVTARTQTITGLVGYFLDHGGRDISPEEQAFIQRFVSGPRSGANPEGYTPADMAQAYSIFRLTDPEKTVDAQGQFTNTAYSWFSRAVGDDSGPAYLGPGLDRAMAWTLEQAGDHPAIELFYIANNRPYLPRGEGEPPVPDQGSPSYGDLPLEAPIVISPELQFGTVYDALSAAYASVPPNGLILLHIQQRMLDDLLHHPERFPNAEDLVTPLRFMAAAGLGEPVTADSIRHFMNPERAPRAYDDLPPGEMALRGEILHQLIAGGYLPLAPLHEAATTGFGGDGGRWSVYALAEYYHGAGSEASPEGLEAFHTLIATFRGQEEATPALREVIGAYAELHGGPQLGAELRAVLTGPEGVLPPVSEIAALVPDGDLTLAVYGLSRYPVEADSPDAVERGGLNALLSLETPGVTSVAQAAAILDHLWREQERFFPGGQAESFERQVVPDLTAAILSALPGDGTGWDAYLGQFSANPELLYRFLQEARSQNPEEFGRFAAIGALAAYGPVLHAYREEQQIGADFLTPLLPDYYLQSLVTAADWPAVYDHLLTNQGTDIATSRTWADFRSQYVTGADPAAEDSPFFAFVTHVMAAHPAQLGEHSVLDQVLQGIGHDQFAALYDRFRADGGLSGEEAQVLALAYGNNPAGIGLSPAWPIADLHAIVGPDPLALAQVFGIDPADGASIARFAAGGTEGGPVLAYLLAHGMISAETLNGPGLEAAHAALAAHYAAHPGELRERVEAFRADGALSEAETGLLTQLFATGEWEGEALRQALPADLSVAQLDGLLNDARLLAFFAIDPADPATVDHFADRNLQAVNEGEVLAHLLDRGLIGPDAFSGPTGGALADLAGYYRYGGNLEELTALAARFPVSGEGVPGPAESAFLRGLFAQEGWSVEQIRTVLPATLTIAGVDAVLPEGQLLGYYHIDLNAAEPFGAPLPGGAELHYLLTGGHLPADALLPAAEAFNALQNHYIALAGSDAPAALSALAAALGAFPAGAGRDDAIAAMFADGTLAAYLGADILTQSYGEAAETNPLLALLWETDGRADTGLRFADLLNAHLPEANRITPFQIATGLAGLGDDPEGLARSQALLAGLLAPELAAAGAVFTTGGALDIEAAAAVQQLKLRDILTLIPDAPEGNRGAFLLGLLESSGHGADPVAWLAAAGFTPEDLQPDSFGLGALNLGDAARDEWRALSGRLAIEMLPSAYTVGETNAYAVGVVEALLEGRFLFDINRDGDVTEADKTAGLIRLAQITALSAGRPAAGEGPFPVSAFGSVMEHFTHAPYTAADLDAFLGEIARHQQELATLSPPPVPLETLLLTGNVPAPVLIHAITHDYLTPEQVADPALNGQLRATLSDALADPARLRDTLGAFGFGAEGIYGPAQLDAREHAILTLVLQPEFLTAHRAALLPTLGGAEGLAGLIEAGVIGLDGAARLFHDAEGRVDAGQIAALAEPGALSALLARDTAPYAAVRALFTGPGGTPDADALATRPALAAALLNAGVFGPELAAVFDRGQTPLLNAYLESEGIGWERHVADTLAALAEAGVNGEGFAALLAEETQPAVLLAALTQTRDGHSLLSPDRLSGTQREALLTALRSGDGGYDIAVFTENGLSPQEADLLALLAARHPDFAAAAARPLLAGPDMQRLMAEAPEAFFDRFAPLFFTADGAPVAAGEPPVPVLAYHPAAMAHYASRLADADLSAIRAHYDRTPEAYEQFLQAVAADGAVSADERALIAALGIPEGYTPAGTLPLYEGLAVIVDGQVLSALSADGFLAQIDRLREPDGSLSETATDTLALLYAAGPADAPYPFPADLAPETVDRITGGRDGALLAAYGIDPSDPASLAAFAASDRPNTGQVLDYLIREGVLPPASLTAGGDAAVQALAAFYAADGEALTQLAAGFGREGDLSAAGRDLIAALYATGALSAGQLAAGLADTPVSFDTVTGLAPGDAGRALVTAYYALHAPDGATLHRLLTTPAEAPYAAPPLDDAQLAALQAYYAPAHLADLAGLAARHTEGRELTAEGRALLAPLFQTGTWEDAHLRAVLPEGLSPAALDGVLTDSQLRGYYHLNGAPPALGEPLPNGEALHYLMTHRDAAGEPYLSPLLPAGPSEAAALAALERYYSDLADRSGAPAALSELNALLAAAPEDRHPALIAALFGNGTLLAHLGAEALDTPFPAGGSRTLLDTVNAAVEPDISAFQLATALPAAGEEDRQAILSLITGWTVRDAQTLRADADAALPYEPDAARALKLREMLPLLPAEARGGFLKAVLETADPEARYAFLAAAGFSPLDVAAPPAEDFFGLHALTQAPPQGLGLNPAAAEWGRYYGTAQLLNPLIYTTAEVNAYAVNVVEEMLAGGIHIDLDRNGRVDAVDETTALSRLAAMTAFSAGRDDDGNPDTPLLFPIDSFGRVMEHFTHAPYTAAHLDTFLTEMLRQQQAGESLTPPVIAMERLMLEGNVPAPVLIHALTRSPALEGREAGLPFLDPALLGAPEGEPLRAALRGYLAEPAALSATLAAFGRDGTLDPAERAILSAVLEPEFLTAHRAGLLTALGVEGLVALTRADGAGPVLSAADAALLFHDAAGNLDRAQLAALAASADRDALLALGPDYLRPLLAGPDGETPDTQAIAEFPALAVALIRQGALDSGGVSTATRLAPMLAGREDAAAFLRSLTQAGLTAAELAALLADADAPTLLAALTPAPLLAPEALTAPQREALIAHLTADFAPVAEGGITPEELALLRVLIHDDAGFAARIAPAVLASAERLLVNDTAAFITGFRPLFMDETGAPNAAVLADHPIALAYLATHPSQPPLNLGDAALASLQQAYAADPARYDRLLAELGRGGLSAAEQALLVRIGSGWFPEGYEPRVERAEQQSVTVGELLNLSLAQGPYSALQLQEYVAAYLAEPGGAIPPGFTRAETLDNLTAAIAESGLPRDAWLALVTQLPETDRGAAIGLLAERAGGIDALWSGETPSFGDAFLAAMTAAPAGAGQLETIRTFALFSAALLGSPPRDPEALPAPIGQEWLDTVRGIPAESIDQYRAAWIAADPAAEAWFTAHLMEAGHLTTAQLNELLREGVVSGADYAPLAATAAAGEFAALAERAAALPVPPTGESLAGAAELARESYRLLAALGDRPDRHIDDMILALPDAYRTAYLDALLAEHAAAELLHPSDRGNMLWLSEQLLTPGSDEYPNRLTAATAMPHVLRYLNERHDRDGTAGLSESEAPGFARDLAAFAHTHVDQGGASNLTAFQESWGMLEGAGALDDFFRELEAIHATAYPDADSRAWLESQARMAGLSASQLAILEQEGLIDSAPDAETLRAAEREAYYALAPEPAAESGGQNCVEQILSAWGLVPEPEHAAPLVNALSEDNFIVTSYGDEAESPDDLVFHNTAGLDAAEAARVVGGLNDLAVALDGALFDLSASRTPGSGEQLDMAPVHAAFAGLAADLGDGARLGFAYENGRVELIVRDGQFYAAPYTAGAEPFTLTESMATALYRNAADREQALSASIHQPSLLPSMTVTMPGHPPFSTDTILTYGMVQQVQNSSLSAAQLFEGDPAMQPTVQALAGAVQSARGAGS